MCGEKKAKSYLVIRRMDCGTDSRHGRLGNIIKHIDMWDNDNEFWPTGSEEK